jgi:hypothetical protein
MMPPISANVSHSLAALPDAPSSFTAVLQSGPSIKLTWRDNSNNESYFLLERSVDGGAFALLAMPAGLKTTGSAAYIDSTVTADHCFCYRLTAVNSAGSSASILSPAAAVPLPPAAPSNLIGSAAAAGRKAKVTISWLDYACDETGFEVERASNPAFTVGLNRSAVAAKTGSSTLVTAVQTGLYRGVIYYYRVRTVNLGGPSAWSNMMTIVTP